MTLGLASSTSNHRLRAGDRDLLPEPGGWQRRRPTPEPAAGLQCADGGLPLRAGLGRPHSCACRHLCCGMQVSFTIAVVSNLDLDQNAWLLAWLIERRIL